MYLWRSKITFDMPLETSLGLLILAFLLGGLSGIYVSRRYFKQEVKRAMEDGLKSLKEAENIRLQ